MLNESSFSTIKTFTLQQLENFHKGYEDKVSKRRHEIKQNSILWSRTEAEGFVWSCRTVPSGQWSGGSNHHGAERVFHIIRTGFWSCVDSHWVAPSQRCRGVVRSRRVVPSWRWSAGSSWGLWSGATWSRWASWCCGRPCSRSRSGWRNHRRQTTNLTERQRQGGRRVVWDEEGRRRKEGLTSQFSLLDLRENCRCDYSYSNTHITTSLLSRSFSLIPSLFISFRLRQSLDSLRCCD